MLQLEKRVGKTPFFIQVGANDGSMADPFSLLSKRWHGLMIEPQPDVFERLVASRSANNLMQFANVAISNSEGQLTLYCIDLPGNRDVTGVASLEKEVVVKHLENGYLDKIANRLGIPLPQDRTALIKETKVRMCPLSTLIEERSIRQVDALFIDVEGHEYQVLKSFPFAKHRPGLIVYEQIHLTPELAAECRHLLRSHSYALISEGMDVIALASDALE
jgi:FkbM family methyltransferase